MVSPNIVAYRAALSLPNSTLMDKPFLDESKATEYIGKTILIRVTYFDHEERLLGQHQWFGTILTFSNAEGIKIELRNSDVPWALPPDP
jgi:hypothetical protein